MMRSHRRLALVDAAARLRALSLVIGLSLALLPRIALAADSQSDDEDETSGAVVSIDLAATYATASGFGFLFSPARLTTQFFTAPSSKSLTLDVPLKIDFNDRFSAYAGVVGSMDAFGGQSWSSFQLSAWRIGFSADVVQQQEFTPTVTLSGFVSRPFDREGQIFRTTTWSAAIDLERSLDAEETYGWLAGGAYTRIVVDGGPLDVRPVAMIHAGAFRMIEDWKLSARFGVQQAGGAHLAGLIDVTRITTPFVKLDLEKLDEDDNRLIGLSAAVGWSPKPSVQFILNVPIYIAGR